MVVITLANDSALRVPRVKDFQLPTHAAGFVAYLQLPEHSPSKKPEAHHRKVEAGDLVLRDLEDGNERRFPQVSEYSLTNDAKSLVYALAASDSAPDGVYAVVPGSAADASPLLSGAGKYEKLAWDEDQTRLAFLSDYSRSANGVPANFKLYAWDRRGSKAIELVSDRYPGFPPGWVISSQASLSLAKGANSVFFGVMPRRSKPTDINTPEEDRVSVDLWSWRDDYIQPMQKSRARTERARSYRAVYDIAQKKFTRLADPAMNDVLPSEDGLFAIGNDDRPYRRMEDYDGRYFDSYVVDCRTGERKLVASKHPNRVTWSPTSRYAIYFDGKNWIALSTGDARAINLTGKLGVSFANEQNDTPGLADSYRLGGWSRDGGSVFLYDRYDLWRCSPDGSSAVNLTQGYGRRNHLQFRIVRFETDDPASRWIDPAKPLLLRAENDQTRETGFYRASVGGAGAPEKLIYAAQNFAPPIKARDADVYVTAASTFSEYPDLLVTDGAFRELHKVSDANPQLAGLLWGTAELVHFNNEDGAPLEATLYKPENFDPKKKYPLLVYIYERLTQNVNNFIEPRPSNVINPSVYVEQRLSGAGARHRVQGRLSGPERAQLRSAGSAGRGQSGLRRRERHRHSGAQLGRLPDRLHDHAHQPLPRSLGGRSGSRYD